MPPLKKSLLQAQNNKKSLSLQSRCGCVGTGRQARLRIWCFGVWVRVPSPAQRKIVFMNLNRYSCIILCFVSLLAFNGCNEDRIAPWDNTRISQVLLNDFYSRNPGATITEASLWSQDNRMDIAFTDPEGIPGIEIYDGGTWLMTQKEYDRHDFMNQIPFSIAMAYLEACPGNEEYDSDNSYVVEISRNGIDGKQYEFCFTAPYKDEKHSFEHLSYHIVISEDGTLLNRYNHFNRSVWWSDMRQSISIVNKKYPSAKILGAVNDGHGNLFFIRDEGLTKKVWVRKLSDWEWEKTVYRLPDETPLPESAKAMAEEYSSAHKDIPLSAILHVEDRWGEYFGLQFGDDLENTTIYSKID